MFKLIALTLAAISAVHSIAIPHVRRDASTYDSDNLEVRVNLVYISRYQSC